MIPKEIIDKLYNNIYDLWLIDHSNKYKIVLQELITPKCTCRHTDPYYKVNCDFCGRSDLCKIHKEEAGYVTKCRGGCKAYFCDMCGDVYGCKECNECMGYNRSFDSDSESEWDYFN